MRHSTKQTGTNQLVLSARARLQALLLRPGRCWATTSASQLAVVMEPRSSILRILEGRGGAECSASVGRWRQWTVDSGQWTLLRRWPALPKHALAGWRSQTAAHPKKKKRRGLKARCGLLRQSCACWPRAVHWPGEVCHAGAAGTNKQKQIAGKSAHQLYDDGRCLGGGAGTEGWARWGYMQYGALERLRRAPRSWVQHGTVIIEGSRG
ncbi:hypothetical protein P154DRAFT_19208 [Amniculicola lignicola CBS 123094]|uniref:Uncharacterized protein n=1 Tax=Amniculicola lignicola CBS 123094 TaxID=1392246 RepID=A0A6A5WSY1_9PLEO|nr:hypothetical protein P154DRAFT_19208 [Amniculicola lignicola CBS 123094]